LNGHLGKLLGPLSLAHGWPEMNLASRWSQSPLLKLRVSDLIEFQVN
jgi:hypothetical protein